MKLFITVITLFTINLANAQKYYTKSGNISFTSKAPLETIEAINKASACVLDTKAGTVDFAVQIKSFVFQKKLMQEHFNENYMESDKFPKATFKGLIDNNTIQYNTGGTYDVTVSGKLTIHGITKDVANTGKLIVSGEKITAISEFSVSLSDYGIKIPSIVKDNISNTVNIVVNAELEPLNK